MAQYPSDRPEIWGSRDDHWRATSPLGLLELLLASETAKGCDFRPHAVRAAITVQAATARAQGVLEVGHAAGVRLERDRQRGLAIQREVRARQEDGRPSRTGPF